MPVLGNKKRELFARFLADPTITQAQAYELAGYTPSSSNASILANTEEMKHRVAEIREEQAKEKAEFKLRMIEAGIDPDSPQGDQEQQVWDADRVRNMLATNASMAQVVGDFKSAMESIALIGKSLQMFDKDNDTRGGNSSRPEISFALINQATGGDSQGSRTILVETDNPLAPRLPSAGEPERLEQSGSTAKRARRS